MRKPSRFKKRACLWIVSLAVLCIGGAELVASYFFAPEWFAKTTAPIRSCVHSVASFCRETGSSFLASVAELREKAEPQDSQFADGALYGVTAEFADPSITELKSVGGVEILTGGIVALEYFNQSSAPWADLPYGSDDIGRYGCGPTAMAMVVNSMTEHESDPEQMAQWAVDQHHWARRSGSYLSIVEGASQAFGLEAYSIAEKTPAAIQAALLSGDLIVALMGPGHFTKGGHFIVIHGVTLSGSLLVADPSSTERSLMEWDPELILSELSGSTHSGAPLWGISQHSG